MPLAALYNLLTLSRMAKRRKYQIITCLKALNHNKRQLKYDVKLRNAIKSPPKNYVCFSSSFHPPPIGFSLTFLMALNFFDFSTLSKTRSTRFISGGMSSACDMSAIEKHFLMNTKLNNKERERLRLLLERWSDERHQLKLN